MNLFRDLHVGVPNHPERHNDHDEIGQYVEDAAYVEQHRSVDTVAGYGIVPGAGPRDALPYLDDGCGDVEERE